MIIKVECKRFFVENGETNSKGKPIKFPVTIRKMTLDGNFVGAKRFRIVQQTRKGQVTYSITFIPEPKKALWPSLDLAPRATEETWKRWDRMNEGQAAIWVKRLAGEQGARAFDELVNSEPTQLAAA